MAVAGGPPIVIRRVEIGRLRSLLERFRRNAGVPAAVGSDLSAELAPVFAALDEIEREVARIREESEASAVARLQEAEEEAETIVREARRLAAKEGYDAFRAALRLADAEAEAIARQAKAEAEATWQFGAERVPGLVTKVLSRAREAGS